VLAEACAVLVGRAALVEAAGLRLEPPVEPLGLQLGGAAGDELQAGLTHGHPT
jgi:hypothetical protein